MSTRGLASNYGGCNQPTAVATVVSSTTPQESNDDGPRPHLVVSTPDDVWRLAYLPDGQVVTGSSSSEGATVRVWNVENGRQEGRSMKHEHGLIISLAVTRDGKKIVSSDEGGRIKVWDVESHSLVKEWTHSNGFSRIAISPDDRLVAVGGLTVSIHTMEGQVKQSIKTKGAWCMSFSPDGCKLACGDDDIYVYDVSNGTLVLGPLAGHRGVIPSVLWSHDGSRIFSGSLHDKIRCWDSATGEPIGHPWTGHTDYITSFSFSLSPDGSILASASGDRTIRFWDTTTGNPVGQPLRHKDKLRHVCFSPSGEFVASAGWGGKLHIWRVPRLDAIESRLNVNFFECSDPLALTLPILSQTHAVLLDVSLPHDTQAPPPPYSTHSSVSGQPLDLGLFVRNCKPRILAYLLIMMLLQAICAISHRHPSCLATQFIPYFPYTRAKYR